jgi:hypothetical protein
MVSTLEAIESHVNTAPMLYCENDTVQSVWRTVHEADLERCDGEIVEALGHVYGDGNILTYDQARRDIVPLLFTDTTVMHSLISHAGHTDGPRSIESFGLQVGSWGIHFAHRLSWRDGTHYSVVSYISRWSNDCAFGDMTKQEYADIVQLHNIMQTQPAHIRAIVDIVDPLSIMDMHSIYPTRTVYFTRMDETHGELHVYNLRVSDGTILPILTYAIPYTPQMRSTQDRQKSVVYSLLNYQDETLNRGLLTDIRNQWRGLARSLAVFGHATGYLPKYISLNSGDLMGTIENSWIDGVRLVVPGSLRRITSDEDIIQTLRSYEIQEAPRKYPVFSALSDEDMHETVREAHSFVVPPQIR